MSEAPATFDATSMRPGDAIRIPAGANEDEIRAMCDAAYRADRNAKIRKAYESMKDASGQFPNGYEAAREAVAEQFHVSKRTVHRAVSGA